MYEFEVTNRAGTYWYHPHPHMRTGAQVYQGLAGLLLIRDDEEEALALPSGGAELLCVLQDREFDARNQLVFHGDGMMDDDERLSRRPCARERPAAADDRGGCGVAPGPRVERVQRAHL